jgi:hypothetical protein
LTSLVHATGQHALQPLHAINSTTSKDRSGVQEFWTGWHLEKVTKESLAFQNTLQEE